MFVVKKKQQRLMLSFFVGGQSWLSIWKCPYSTVLVTSPALHCGLFWVSPPSSETTEQFVLVGSCYRRFLKTSAQPVGKGYLSSSEGDRGWNAEGPSEVGSEALKVAPLDFQSIQSKALHTVARLLFWVQTTTGHSVRLCAWAYLKF